MTSAAPLPFDGGIFSPLETFACDAASRAGACLERHDQARADAAKPGAERTAGRPAADCPQSHWRHACVRDLAWLLQSPPLLSATSFPARLADPQDPAIFGPTAAAALMDLLKRLDADPHDLQIALSAHPERRLGRYAERLLAEWLTRAPGVSVTALGLPVRETADPATAANAANAADAAGAPTRKGRTLGECDALFDTTTGAREHWEMAVKFYLYVDDDGASAQAFPESASAARPLLTSTLKGCDAFVGAGLADRLDWKLQRLIAHQLPLSNHPALLAMAPGPWQARMFVKGRLFYPLMQWRALLPDAPALARDHARGWWATLDTWLAWSRTTDCHWTSLARLDWLAPLRVEGERISDTATFAQMLCEHFDGDERGEGSDKGSNKGGKDGDRAAAQLPRQVAALRPIEGTQGAYELSRGFIVPNGWPARAMRFRSHHQ